MVYLCQKPSTESRRFRVVGSDISVCGTTVQASGADIGMVAIIDELTDVLGILLLAVLTPLAARHPGSARSVPST